MTMEKRKGLKEYAKNIQTLNSNVWRIIENYKIRIGMWSIVEFLNDIIILLTLEDRYVFHYF